jgi:hypothetical protein
MYDILLVSYCYSRLAVEAHQTWQIISESLPALLLLPALPTPILHTLRLQVSILALGIRLGLFVPDQALYNLTRSVLLFASQGRVLQVAWGFH